MQDRKDPQMCGCNAWHYMLFVSLFISIIACEQTEESFARDIAKQIKRYDFSSLSTKGCGRLSFGNRIEFRLKNRKGQLLRFQVSKKKQLICNFGGVYFQLYQYDSAGLLRHILSLDKFGKIAPMPEQSESFPDIRFSVQQRAKLLLLLKKIDKQGGNLLIKDRLITVAKHDSFGRVVHKELISVSEYWRYQQLLHAP